MPLRKKVLLLHFEIENHKTIMDKIRIGITHGDLNGVGYEIILKAFADAELSNCCVPIVYGSPRAAIYYRKNLNLQTNFKSVSSAKDAAAGMLNMVVCI